MSANESAFTRAFTRMATVLAAFSNCRGVSHFMQCNFRVERGEMNALHVNVVVAQRNAFAISSRIFAMKSRFRTAGQRD